MAYRVAVFGILLAACFLPADAQQQRRQRDRTDVIIGQQPVDNTQNSVLQGVVRIKGTITDNEHVRLEVRDIGTGGISASGYADGAGYFAVPGLRPGEYEVVATLGLDEVRERVRVGAGDGQNYVSLLIIRSGSGEQKGSDRHSVSVGEMQTPDKAQKHLNNAQKLADKGDNEGARKEVEKALSVYPRFAGALTLRGIIAMTEGGYQTALTDLDEAVKADPQYALAYIALGAAYNGVEKFDDALRALDRASTLAPKAWQVPFENARALLGKGDFAAALKEATRAQALIKKSFPDLLLVKAHALIGMKDYDGAIAEFESFLGSNPDAEQATTARAQLENIRAFANREQ